MLNVNSFDLLNKFLQIT